MKKIGPIIDPCGTPLSILKKDDEVLFIILYIYYILYYIIILLYILYIYIII